MADRRRAYRVFDEAGFEALLDRVAAGILASGHAPDLLLGVRRRGVPLAHALGGRLARSGAGAPPVHEIGLRRYADDLTLLHPETALEDAPPESLVKGASVLVVDDVLYTGRTLLRAAGWCAAAGAERVTTAVLCARAGREVPVGADHVGAHLEVGEDTIVEVRTPPFETERTVTLVRRPGA